MSRRHRRSESASDLRRAERRALTRAERRHSTVRMHELSRDPDRGEEVASGDERVRVVLHSAPQPTATTAEIRHWKTRMWKRRTAERRRRAEMIRRID